MATRHGTIRARAGEFTAKSASRGATRGITANRPTTPTAAVHPVTSYTWSPTTTFVSAVPMRDHRYRATSCGTGCRPERGQTHLPARQPAIPGQSLTPIMDVMSVRLKGLLRGLAELLPSKGLRPPLLCQRPVAWRRHPDTGRRVAGPPVQPLSHCVPVRQPQRDQRRAVVVRPALSGAEQGIAHAHAHAHTTALRTHRWAHQVPRLRRGARFAQHTHEADDLRPGDG